MLEDTGCACTLTNQGATFACEKATPTIDLLGAVTIPSIAFSVATDVSPCATPAYITASGSIDLPGSTSDALESLINTAIENVQNGDSIEFDGTTNTITISETVIAGETHTIDVPVFTQSVLVGTVTASLRYILELTSVEAGKIGMTLHVDFCIQSTISGLSGDFCGADLWTSVKNALGNPPYSLFETTAMDFSEYCESLLEDPEDPCFDSSATVTLENGTVTRLDELMGTDDAIIAADRNGVITKGKLSFLSHSDVNVEATFVVLSTEDGYTLTLTPQHHVPTGLTNGKER